MYEYTETDDEIVIYMEKISDCKYFETKLCDRKREIKNEDKIRRYVK